MSDVVISVEKLGKKYRIGRNGQRHDTLRDSLVAALQAPLRRWRRNGTQPEEDTIWALKDVSFEVKQGEVVGIIGRNGAGKSTLLKILSQITEPTSGRAVINGRVGSLLEVGTGFHPELTGHENIYLNGAILGMRRDEIRRQFDEIVAFSEIEKFLDTPVKRYSSGMYVRLAFAVAAHLEPEILLVDEVLAVGDAAFQKKCLGKMSEVASQGRTVLFVSHNTSAIQRLCGKAVLLDKGSLVMYDSTSKVLVHYLATHAETVAPGQWIWLRPTNGQEKGGASFSALGYSSNVEAIGNYAYVDGPLDVSLRIRSDASRQVGSMAVTFYDAHGTKLVNCDTVSLGLPIQLEAGENVFVVSIAQLHLNPGIYTVGLWLANLQHSVLDRIDSAFRIEILDRPGVVGSSRPEFDGSVSSSFSVIPSPRGLPEPDLEACTP